MKIDALVPAYNEEPRVGGVLQTLNDSPLINKIIFVDGGSTDRTLEIAKGFSKVKILALGEKGGKGQDVGRGLSLVESPAVFLCDADLIGLKEENIKSLVEAYAKNTKGLVVGLTQKNDHYYYHWIRANLLPLISGMRVISVEDLKNVLSSPLSNEYGIEPYMNYYFYKKRQPISKILLEGVNDIPKPRKHGHGWKPHLEEGLIVVSRYLTIYAKQAPKDAYESLKSFIFPAVEERPQTFKTNQTLIKGININYAKMGSGQPLVFVHGWANNWEGWLPVVDYLKSNFSLYLVDLPGFGDSGNLPEYSVESASEYLIGFVGQLPQKPQAIIGLSMGSLVVAEAVNKYSEICQKAVLVGPVLKEGGRNLAAKTLKYSLILLRYFTPGEAALKKIIETRIAAYAMSKYVNMYKFNRFLVDSYGMIGKKKMRKEAFTQMGISAANYELNKILEEIKVKTLLVYGREDKVSSPQFATEKILPKNALISCISIPEAGHVVPMEKPQEVAAAIRQFLAK